VVALVAAWCTYQSALLTTSDGVVPRRAAGDGHNVLTERQLET
jgi:hypothetical protein